MANKVDSTLEERGSVYGDYEGGSKFRASVMHMIHSRYEEIHGTPMNSLSSVYIFDIVNKLSRLTVTPDHIDTWLDISGYAKLTHDILLEKEQTFTGEN